MKDKRKDKRYVVQIEFYIFAKTDYKAIDFALGIARRLCQKFDNQAKVTNLWGKPFASLEAKKIALPHGD